MPGDAGPLPAFRHLYLSVPAGWSEEVWARSLRQERDRRRDGAGGELRMALSPASLLVGGAAPWALGRGLVDGVRKVLPELREAPPREWTVEVGDLKGLGPLLPLWHAGGVTRIALRGAAASGWAASRVRAPAPPGERSAGRVERGAPRRAAATAGVRSGEAGVARAVEAGTAVGLEVGVEVAFPRGEDPHETARRVRRLVEAGAHALAWMEEEERDATEAWQAAVEVVQGAGWDTPDLATAHRPGKAPRHREAIRRREPVLGLGPGAVTFRNPRREWNLDDPRRYLKAMEGGATPVQGEETLTREERCLERCWSALRTRDGFRLPRTLAPLVEPWEAAGWAQLLRGAMGVRVLPTLRGWREADALAVALLHALEGGSLEPRDAGNWSDDVRT